MYVVFMSINIVILHLVDCVWKEYNEWTSCSRSCGGGKRYRTRTIKTPESNGGKECAGSEIQEEDCNSMGCKGKGEVYYLS